MIWIIAAFFSAIFTSASALISKRGLDKADSTLATTLRTDIVLLCTIAIAAATGSLEGLTHLDAFSLLFMVLSGISTAFCSVCYYKAISLGSVSKVLPIEKSSIVITLLFAIFYFHENSFLKWKLFGVALIFVGLPLLIAAKGGELEAAKPHFYTYAFGASLFAALNTIFSKIGIQGLNSELATAINTVLEAVVLGVWISLEKKWVKIKEIPRNEWKAILLSGLATSGSWICYYYAVKRGALSVVVPLNKLSVPFTAVCSHFLFGEHISKRMAAGLALIVAGMMLVAVLG
ncbi:MAG: EamA family transporter [Lachnospiraceae bacterium]|nr:EamA family transporter [Lachnospiraceae bacterium]